MGTLNGTKIIEVGGIGPGPFCGMMLSDMGAEVVRIERKGQFMLTEPKCHMLTRNRRSVEIDLGKAEGVYARADTGRPANDRLSIPTTIFGKELETDGNR